MLKNFKRCQEGKELIKHDAIEENMNDENESIVSSESVSGIKKEEQFRWSKHKLVEKMENKGVDGHVLRMLAASANKYDLIVGKDFLKAFQTTNIEYKKFREFCKDILKVEFTDEEFALVCKFYDIAHTGTVIDGMEFLKCFTILKTLYSGAENARIRQKEAEFQERVKQKEIKKKEELERKFFITPNYDVSPAEEKAAIDKLVVAATRYDKNHPSSMGLDGFQVKRLRAGEFRELVRRTFNLMIDSKELGVLIKNYGDVETNTINCDLFIKKFLKIGFNERNKAKLEQLRISNEAEEANRKYIEDLIHAAHGKMEVGVTANFLPEDQKSALEKLRVAAAKYRKDHPSSMGLDGFDGQYLSAGQFREMMKRTFNIQLTREELSALVYAFDADECQKVKCSQFLLYFSKVGFMERSKEHVESLEKCRRMQQMAALEEAKKLEDQWGKLELSQEQLEAFQPEDMDSAMYKLRYAARWYDKSSESGISLKGFSGAIMSPATFREMCRRCLQFKLTIPELAALCHTYKKKRCADGSPARSRPSSPEPNTRVLQEESIETVGTASSTLRGSSRHGGLMIDLELFRLKFGIMSFEEKEALRAEQRGKKFRAQQLLDAAEEENRRRELAFSLGKNEIDHDFGKEDEESGMAKMRQAAAHFNHNSVGLSGFNITTMRPKVIREMIRRTFHIILTPKELAAVVKDMIFEDGSIDVEAFLALFNNLKRQFRNEERIRQIAEEKRVAQLHEAESRVLAAKRNEEEQKKLCHAAEDELSLMVKLKRVSQMYTLDSGNYNEKLQAFKGPPKSPSAFRTLFEHVFRTKLSHAEAGLLMNIIDPKLAKSMMIDGSFFLLGFFKLARLQAKVLLGIINDNSINLSIFQADRSKTAASNGGKDQGAMHSSESSSLAGSLAGSMKDMHVDKLSDDEASPMLHSLLHGVNPYVDWEIGKKAYFETVPQLRGKTMLVSGKDPRESTHTYGHRDSMTPDAKKTRQRPRTVSPLKHTPKSPASERNPHGPSVTFGMLARPSSTINLDAIKAERAKLDLGSPPGKSKSAKYKKRGIKGGNTDYLTSPNGTMVVE